MTQPNNHRSHPNLNIRGAKSFQQITNYKYDLRVAQNTRTSASYEHNGIFILCEGVFLNNRRPIQDTVTHLYQKYVHEGELFAKSLRGSFQIVIVDARGVDDKYFIISDHIASRQIFYTITKEFLFFSPDIKDILPHTFNNIMDEMAMVHFLVTGHFPRGHTAIREIKILGPGEYLSIHSGIIEKNRYINFNIEPDEEMDIIDAATSLDTVLTDRIMDHWSNAESPAILLSGGFDSQYIFNTIAESVEDTSKLTTVTWGQNPNKPHADMSIARRIAKRFCTHHIEIVKTLDNWRTEYDEMFVAQNGMTDSSFYHANELTVCKRLSDNFGIKSVIRGDECFGFGPDAFTAQNALVTNSMSFPDYIRNFAGWFQPEYPIAKQYSTFMEEFLDKYQYQSFDCLKDLIDFYERQHMNRNPLNYFKLHHLEVFCPMIDPDVLHLISEFPSKFRRNKELFKKITRHKIGKQLEIAEFTNLTNWEEVLSGSNSIKKFFKNEFSKLPYFLDPVFFHNLIRSLENRSGPSIKTRIKDRLRPLKRIAIIDALRQSVAAHRHYADQSLQIPAHMLVIRAAVLSRWNQWWISKN